jgi:hypothetical protein
VPYIYLQFPELKDFIAYLKSQNIDTVGIVERVNRRTLKSGIPIARYYFRLTAKDERHKEIVLCDITYYESADIAIDREQIQKPRKQVEEEIEKAFAEEAAKGVIFKRIKAEFTPKPITV